MATRSPHGEHPEPIFRGFEVSVERLLGTDMRLVYGLLVPILMLVGLIVVLALQPATWLVVSIVVVEIGLLATVITGLLGMMRSDDDDQTDVS
jgi:hypothetical protein